MNNQYNINLRSIKAFKNITESSLEIIRNNATYIEYEMGKPIINDNIIPNKIASNADCVVRSNCEGINLLYPIITSSPCLFSMLGLVMICFHGHMIANEPNINPVKREIVLFL